MGCHRSGWQAPALRRCAQGRVDWARQWTLTLLSVDRPPPSALRRGPSNEMLVEIRPAITPPRQAPLRRRDFIEVDLLHQELRLVRARDRHHGGANGIHDHALADVAAAVLVAGAIDGD